MKPEFYVMLRGINGPVLTPFTHEQDALRMAEAELRIMAPHRRTPAGIEVGELVPTAGVVPAPGRYVDGIPFPYSIQIIEGDPVPDELVHAREVAARRDVKLRALRQGLRDVLAEMGEDGYVNNATVTKRLRALLEE
jgi:hypothetical protein